MKTFLLLVVLAGCAAAAPMQEQPPAQGTCPNASDVPCFDGQDLHPTGMCCTKGYVCGGGYPNVGCPAGYCCYVGTALLSAAVDAGAAIQQHKAR